MHGTSISRVIFFFNFSTYEEDCFSSYTLNVCLCPGLRGNLEYNDNYVVLTSRKLFSSGINSGFQHHVSNAVGAIGSQGAEAFDNVSIWEEAWGNSRGPKRFRKNFQMMSCLLEFHCINRKETDSGCGRGPKKCQNIFRPPFYDFWCYLSHTDENVQSRIFVTQFCTSY